MTAHDKMRIKIAGISTAQLKEIAAHQSTPIEAFHLVLQELENRMSSKEYIQFCDAI